MGLVVMGRAWISGYWSTPNIAVVCASLPTVHCKSEEPQTNKSAGVPRRMYDVGDDEVGNRSIMSGPGIPKILPSPGPSLYKIRQVPEWVSQPAWSE